MRAVADGQIARICPWARRHVHRRVKPELSPPKLRQDAVHDRQVRLHNVGQEEILALSQTQRVGGVGR